VFVWNFLMVVVDQIEVVEFDVVPVVDRLDQENLIVHMMFVMNVEVNFFSSKNNSFEEVSKKSLSVFS
jgi:hypothetical protein